MRLINADEIESALRYAEFDRDEKVSWAEAYRHFMEIIENAPTAYDVDKVVEQLGESKEIYPICGGALHVYAVRIDKAINAIKEGGIK